MKKINLYDEGGFPNGCLPDDAQSIELRAGMVSSAVSLNQIYESGTMPVINWDGEFEEWLDRREDVIADFNRDNIGFVLPHNIAKRLGLDTNQLYFSQGSIGSCCGHAFGFAYSSSLLTNIALGGHQTPNLINPIGTYVLSHGGRMANGQTVSKMAQFCNREGNYLIKDIGTQNQRVPSFTPGAKKNALENQSAIVFLNSAEKVRQCLRGGVAVALGNGTRVSGASKDGNGMPLASIGGSWAHATHFAGWVKLKGTDYYLWINSHGKRYVTGTLGETGDGCWMTKDVMDRFLASARGYGDCVAVLAEGKEHRN